MRKAAESEGRTLDEVAQELLTEYVADVKRVREYDSLMEKLQYVRSGGPYTRDELNERR